MFSFSLLNKQFGIKVNEVLTEVSMLKDRQEDTDNRSVFHLMSV